MKFAIVLSTVKSIKFMRSSSRIFVCYSMFSFITSQTWSIASFSALTETVIQSSSFLYNFSERLRLSFKRERPQFLIWVRR